MPEGLGSLRVEGARRRIGGFELEADFGIDAGERVVLPGRSGSGKTTLLRIIAGLEKLDSGRILLHGRDLGAVPPERREIGFVFQSPALFPALSALENAIFGLRLRGVPKARAREQGREWLDRVGLGDRAGSRVGELSGGEAQRVAFVRALIWKPKLLLLDEPFSALDPALRTRLRSELASLHSLWPAPLLLVTHDASDAEELATGRLVVEESGATRRIRRLERA